MQRRRWNSWKFIFVCEEHRILHVYELDENEKLKKKFKRLKHRNLKILNEKFTKINDPCLIKNSSGPNETFFQSHEAILRPPTSNTSLTSGQSIGIEDSSIDTLSSVSLPSYSSNPKALDDDTLKDVQNLSPPPEKPPDENIFQKDMNKTNQLFSLLIENSGDYDINSENDDFSLDQFEY